MKKLNLFAALIAVWAVYGTAPVAVAAEGLTDVVSIQIESALPDFLQVSEVVATESGTLNDLALTSAGATATGTGNLDAASNPNKAIDGIGPSDYPDIYHSDSGNAGERLTIDLASPSSLDRLTIFGRLGSTGGNRARDVYNVTIFGALDQILWSGQLDADNDAHSATVSLVNDCFATVILMDRATNDGSFESNTVFSVNPSPTTLPPVWTITSTGPNIGGLLSNPPHGVVLEGADGFDALFADGASPNVTTATSYNLLGGTYPSVSEGDVFAWSFMVNSYSADSTGTLELDFGNGNVTVGTGTAGDIDISTFATISGTYTATAADAAGGLLGVTFSIAAFSNVYGDDVRLSVQTPEPCNRVDLFYTDQVTLGWWDRGSGSNRDGSFWSLDIPDPMTQPMPFSYVARGDYARPSGGLVAAELVAGALAPPTSFEFVWNDSGSGADLDGVVWKPVPPAGYRCLGMAATTCCSPPPTTTSSMTCLRSDLAVEGTVGALIWNDSGSGANANFSAWDIDCPAGSLDMGGFIGHASHAQPSGPVYCLDERAVGAPAAPSQSEVESLISMFGPVVRFHPQEDYMPGDPETILNDPNSPLVWGLLNDESYDNFDFNLLGSRPTSSSTILDDVQDALSDPSASDPRFRYFLGSIFADGSPASPLHPLALGDLANATSYVRVQPYNGIFTELQFWIYYPWNDAGKLRIVCGEAVEEFFDPTGPRGRHYSDWENIRVRVSDKNVWNLGNTELNNIEISRHDFAEEVAATDPRLMMSGTNPIVYAAKDSHAHYVSPGLHFYERPDSTDIGVCTVAGDLYDLTGDGDELHTYLPGKNAIVSSAWPNIATNTSDWFFFGGLWGKYERQQFCVTVTIFGFGVYTRCDEDVENGKLGLIRRNEWAVPCPENANLGSLRTSAGTLSPAFDPNVTAYNLDGANGLSQLTVTPQAADHNAEVSVSLNGGSGDLVGSGPLLGKASDTLNLMSGCNTIDIRVELPQSCTSSPIEKTYTVTIETADLDGDGIGCGVDNCTMVANPQQIDTDADNIGNACDPDVNQPVNDCFVNFLDLNVYRANFFQAGDLDTDNNGDNFTNFLDLNVVRDFFFNQPGPSANGCN